MRAFKYSGIMMRWQVDKARECEAPRFDGLDCLLRRHSQFRLWSARFAQNRRLLTWTPMPVNDGKVAGWLERLAHCLRQSRPIRNAVKGIGHEDKVNAPPRKFCNVISIARYEIAIRHAVLAATMARHLQKIAVDVDCSDVTGDFGNLQGKPAIPGT